MSPGGKSNSKGGAAHVACWRLPPKSKARAAGGYQQPLMGRGMGAPQNPMLAQSPGQQLSAAELESPQTRRLIGPSSTFMRLVATPRVQAPRRTRRVLAEIRRWTTGCRLLRACRRHKAMSPALRALRDSAQEPPLSRPNSGDPHRPPQGRPRSSGEGASSCRCEDPRTWEARRCGVTKRRKGAELGLQ